MKSNIYIAVFLILSFVVLNAQPNGNRLIINGDSLKGKVVDGINIREVIGNVVIIQEDVKITCNKAIQYLNSNNAELIGDVVITQDSVVIRTEKGRYFGNYKIAYSDSTVFLNNGQLNLKADKGNYNLNNKIANFFGNVEFKDSLKTLTGNKLVYEKNIEKITAIGNVEVEDSLSQLRADSLIHNRNSKFTEGFNNIEIKSETNNLSIFGNHFTDNGEEKVSKVDSSPFLVKLDKHENGIVDTLFIKSKYMEAGKDSGSSLFAIDSVRIVRGNFLSVNDYTIYNRQNEQIIMRKINPVVNPILWYENTQLVGYSIAIILNDGKIKGVNIIKNGLLISKDSTNQFRFNQMSGDSIFMSFSNSRLTSTDVRGNVLSIYYLAEDGNPNGLLKSSAKKIVIGFENSKVSKVNMYGSPVSEYHPENLIEGNEKDFTIPNFILFNNKPDKKVFNSEYLKLMLN